MKLEQGKITWTLVAATSIASFAIVGCGGSQDEPVSHSESSTSSDQVTQAVPAIGPSSPSPAMVASESRVRVMSAFPDSLPPEIQASAVDEIVSGGSVVEIVAQGSPDVTEVVLWDGIGKKQTMTFDSTTGRWRTYYRVPLKSSQEPIGLSVTAKTHSQRWRRVWVFLKFESPETVDSSMVEESEC